MSEELNRSVINPILPTLNRIMKKAMQSYRGIKPFLDLKRDVLPGRKPITTVAIGINIGCAFNTDDFLEHKLLVLASDEKPDNLTLVIDWTIHSSDMLSDEIDLPAAHIVKLSAFTLAMVEQFFEYIEISNLETPFYKSTQQREAVAVTEGVILNWQHIDTKTALSLHFNINDLPKLLPSCPMNKLFYMENRLQRTLTENDLPAANDRSEKTFKKGKNPNNYSAKIKLSGYYDIKKMGFLKYIYTLQSTAYEVWYEEGNEQAAFDLFKKCVRRLKGLAEQKSPENDQKIVVEEQITCP